MNDLGFDAKEVGDNLVNIATGLGFVIIKNLYSFINPLVILV
jgi:hypothetical protein